MKCFHALVTLVSMAIVVRSQAPSRDLVAEAAALTMLDIACQEGTILTVTDAWFGNSDTCTMDIANNSTVNHIAVCCINVMNKMEAFIAGYESYYGVQDSKALINWVSTDDDQFGDDCPGVSKSLWVKYDCN